MICAKHTFLKMLATLDSVYLQEQRKLTCVLASLQDGTEVPFSHCSNSKFDWDDAHSEIQAAAAQHRPRTCAEVLPVLCLHMATAACSVSVQACSLCILHCRHLTPAGLHTAALSEAHALLGWPMPGCGCTAHMQYQQCLALAAKQLHCCSCNCHKLFSLPRLEASTGMKPVL